MALTLSRRPWGALRCGCEGSPQCPHSAPAAGQGFGASSARALGVPSCPAQHPEALLRRRGPGLVSHPGGRSRTLALALVGAQVLTTLSVCAVGRWEAPAGFRHARVKNCVSQPWGTAPYWNPAASLVWMREVTPSVILQAVLALPPTHSLCAAD